MEDLQDILESIFPGVPIFAGRFPDAESARGPSILWRVAATDRLNVFDEPQSGTLTLEIECHAPTHGGAWNIGRDICEQLQRAGRINRVLDQYDEPDDPSQQRGKYFSHIAKVELAA